MPPPPSSQIILYQATDGLPNVDVRIDQNDVWLNKEQLAALFNQSEKVISHQLANIFKADEFEKKRTTRRFLTIEKEDGRIVEKRRDYYNLDLIIALAFRLQSREAKRFRQWAMSNLKEYLIKGVVVNRRRLQESIFQRFGGVISLFKKTVKSQDLKSEEAKGLLDIITNYADSWLLLQRYDTHDLMAPKKKGKARFKLNYDLAINAIWQLKLSLIKRKQASDLFGQEKREMLKAIIGNIYQTYKGKDIYSSLEEKAAHVLYFVIKDHPFNDGNKRIASFLFILFLKENNYLYNRRGEKKVNDNALVAIALLVAQSEAKDKEIMIKLIMNLIAE